MPAALTVPNPFSGFIPGRSDLFQSRIGFDRFERRPGFDRFPRNRFNRFEPRDRFQRRPRREQLPDFIGGGYWPYYPDPNYMPSLDQYARQEPVVEEIRGALALLTTPPSAQVFVDGFYAGTAGDFGFTGSPMSLDAGAHRIDLRAPGYETLSFNVMIEPNDILRYRGEMQLVQPPAATVAAPPQPPVAKSYYVIPKCYAGDRPPRGPLPAGCDRKNMQTYK